MPTDYRPISPKPGSAATIRGVGRTCTSALRTRASRSGARTAKLDPLNSDFDLYSLGPDGESALALPAAPSHDDVVRAKDGKYIGLAVNY